MFWRMHYHASGVPVFACVLLMCFAVRPATGDPLTDSMRREDPRLEQRVTIKAPSVYVGELLERLTALSGVSLAANDRDGAADDKVAVFLKDVPLGDAMNAVWSLVSYRRAEWYWARTGKPGSYDYYLSRPLAAQGLAAQLSQWVQEAFESHAETMLAALSMTPEERKQLEDKDKVAAALLQSDRLRSGLSLLRSVPPDTRASILHGQANVRVPVSALPPAGQEFVHSVWASDASGAKTRAPDGTWTPIPEPTWIQFDANRGVEGQMAPVLYIELEGIGGYGYLGGVPLENKLRNDLSELWMLAGDGRTDPVSRRVPSAPPESRQSEAVRSREGVLERRLYELAIGTPLSLLARLPAKETVDPGACYGASVEAYLDRLRTHPPFLISKWRSHILLVSDPAWFQDEASKPSYSIVKRLRRAASDNSGFLSFDDLATAAGLLSQGQLMRLAPEFPVMAQVSYWHDLLRLCHQSPQTLTRLRSRAGAPVKDDVLATLRSMPGSPMTAILDRGDAIALRFMEDSHADRDPPTREVTFGFVTTSKPWVPVLGFTYEAIPPR